MSQDNSRRQFVKIALGLSGLALVAPRLAMGQERRRGGAAGGTAAGAKTLVKPGEGMAASLNYVEKNSEVKNPSLKVERQGMPFAQQTCANCMFYTADGKIGADDVGKCTIFSNQYVKGAGWCSSWAKKA